MRIHDGLLGLSVIWGPVVWLMAVACAYTAWQPGVTPEATLQLLVASFIFGCWGLWGIIAGPWRVRNWAFGGASFLNLATGLTGRVISNRMQKTVTVAVERLERHGKYGKYVRRTTKLLAHDADGECREGDVVDIAEGRRLSSRKSWRVVRVVKRAGQA